MSVCTFVSSLCLILSYIMDNNGETLFADILLMVACVSFLISGFIEAWRADKLQEACDEINKLKSDIKYDEEEK